MVCNCCARAHAYLDILHHPIPCTVPFWCTILNQQVHHCRFSLTLASSEKKMGKKRRRGDDLNGDSVTKKEGHQRRVREDGERTRKKKKITKSPKKIKI